MPNVNIPCCKKKADRVPKLVEPEELYDFLSAAKESDNTTMSKNMKQQGTISLTERTHQHLSNIYDTATEWHTPTRNGN